MVPIGNGDLAGQDGGASVVTILADLEEVTTFALSQGRHGEVIDDEDIDTGQFCQAFVQSPVGASYGEFAKEYRLAGIEGCVALADSLLGEGTGQKGLAHTAGAKQDEILMSGDPVAGGQGTDEGSIQSSGRTVVDILEASLAVLEMGVFQAPGLDLVLSPEPVSINQPADTLLEAENGGVGIFELLGESLGQAGQAHGVKFFESGYEVFGRHRR